MPVKKLATRRTIIPIEYDPQGFNEWAIYIRNELHCPDKPFDVCHTINEVDRILKYHKPTK